MLLASRTPLHTGCPSGKPFLELGRMVGTCRWIWIQSGSEQLFSQSNEGSFFFSSRINFKLVHSYNVKHLTCIIFCSSGLQNIYTSSIYGSVQHLQYLHWFTKFHIQNRPKGLPVGTY